MNNIELFDNELVDLSDEQQKGIYGGQNCVYESKEYSPGSRLKQGDGQVYTCSADGTWR